MALIEIDPDSFREYVDIYATDHVLAKVENMSDDAIVELIKSNLNEDDLMEVVNEAERVSLSELEFLNPYPQDITPPCDYCGGVCLLFKEGNYFFLLIMKTATPSNSPAIPTRPAMFAPVEARIRGVSLSED